MDSDMRDEAFIIEKEREEDRLLLQVRDAARIAADGDAARSREVLDLISGPQRAAGSGDLRLCEALGDFYRDAEPSVTGLSRSGATDNAVHWYYKAASASRYPRRGECGMQIALLSFLPKYGNVRFKQAKDWFGRADASARPGHGFVPAASPSMKAATTRPWASGRRPIRSPATGLERWKLRACWSGAAWMRPEACSG